MATNSEFAQILQEKMGEDTPTPQSTPALKPHKEQYFQPILSFFMEKKTWRPKRSQSSYPRTMVRRQKKSPTRPVYKSLKKADQENPTLFSCKNLDQNTQSLLENFIDLGAKINKDSFSLIQLKAEYRRLVKAHHPDLSQASTSAVIFQKTLRTYRDLQKNLKKKAEL